MKLQISAGFTSLKGPRERNEDFAGVQHPDPADKRARGVIAAIADGVSSAGGGQQAAQTSVISLLEDFNSAPATWETTVVLDRLLQAHNAWLFATNQRAQKTDNATLLETTLTAIALVGNRYTLAHVGDTRCYLLRRGELFTLTDDHVRQVGQDRGGLTRALGIDSRLAVDFYEGPILVDDLFLLLSDGVYGALKTQRLVELLRATADGAVLTPQALTDALTEAAIAANGTDNATALALRVTELASADFRTTLRQATQLSPPQMLANGNQLDGLTIIAKVADNGINVVYQVSESVISPISGAELHYALKTVHQSRAHDPEECANLVHEHWLALAIDDVGVARAAARPGGHAPSALYTLYEWLDGETLLQQLQAAAQARHKLSAADWLPLAERLVQTVARMHRKRIIHRDIKPQNIFITRSGEVKLMDFGVAISGAEPRASNAIHALHAGTPSFINPEQWGGAAADEKSDLFAIGITLYQTLTQQLPYGEVEPYQIGRYRRDPPLASHYRPDIPLWISHWLAHAIALQAHERFETAEEMLLALERGGARTSTLKAPPATPLLARDPATPWQLGLALSVLFNVLLVAYVLIVKG